MDYILLYFPDGTFMTMTTSNDMLLPRASDFQFGTRFFKVSGELTIADISEIYSGNGFEREVYPARLGKLIESISVR